MPGLLEDNGPSFLSSETADAALSEVRKTRLRLNALDALNALLDELLFNILKNSSSLSTDRLRASLLGLLPTSLGKEALLDAQVELRTYYTQMGTNAVLPQDDDSKTFNLQYAFELLRLKCAAYSTLNGADEDTKAEARVMEKMRDTGAAPFSPFRIAPASLYLTAIIEAVCEHMLGNVARVAARDSSRTDATINDLFIALCEDEAIYGSFKSMKVYEQIEQLSNASQQQTQRGKSFRRGSKHSMSRLSSAHHDPTATMMSSPNSSYTRVSAETLTTQVGTASGHGSQPSSAGGGKKFINNRPSHDSFSIVAHKRAQSDSSKLTSSALEDHNSYEDAEALQEFDDLMRTSSTMKVSLTPDRLKTMEAYKHEKDQKVQRPPFGTKIQFDTTAITRRASTREVHSIVEDEEESSFSKQPPPRHRQGTGTPPPSPSLISATSRIRSVSMSSPGSRAFGKKVIRNVPPPVSSTRLFQNSPPPPPSPNMLSPPEPNTFPSRTRKIQRNLETMDIDDVMNGSDEEQSDPPPRVPAKAPATLRSQNRPGRSGLSASTRDLIDFLAEGPPESRNGDVLDSPNGSITADNGKKNPGRLQRMISKLNLGGSERGPMKHSPPPQTLGNKGSNGALSSLANKPVPPRYPRPPSPPPSSPSSTEEPTILQAKLLNGRDQDTRLARSPKALQSPSTPVITPKRDEDDASKHQGHETDDKDAISNSVNHRSPASAGYPKSPASTSLTRSLSCRKPVPPLEPPTPPPAAIVASPASSASGRLPDGDIREMHRLMSQAASADECRLILDMFLAKSGIQMDRAKPRTVPFTNSLSAIDSPLENAVIELLLGGEIPTEALTSPRKLRSKKHKKGLTLRPHTTDGSSPQGSPVANAFPIAAAS